MPKAFTKDVGTLNPNFSAGAVFKLEVNPPSGILKALRLYYRGDHTTAITGAFNDGETRIFQSLQVTFPRLGLPPIVWNVEVRDLKYITSYFARHLPPTANPAGSGAIHFGMVDIPLALPRHLTRVPERWGLDTRDLGGPIVIEGTYAGVASIGTGSTAITNITSVTALMTTRGARILPGAVLAANQNNIPMDADARRGPDILSTGNIENLWGLMLRQHDNSASTAQRVDGLVTRFKVEHSQDLVLADELFIIQKKSTGIFFGLDAAAIADGIAIPVFGEDGKLGSMPRMTEGRKLTLISDTLETVPVEVTNVTPAASDAVVAIAIGAQLTAAGLAEIGQGQGRGLALGR